MQPRQGWKQPAFRVSDRSVTVQRFLNAEGDLVTWEELNDAEVSYYSDAVQVEVAINGMFVSEYARKFWLEEYFAHRYIST
jgi:hypothetical protein